jgi:hypothetical protein
MIPHDGPSARLGRTSTTSVGPGDSRSSGPTPMSGPPGWSGALDGLMALADRAGQDDRGASTEQSCEGDGHDAGQGRRQARRGGSYRGFGAARGRGHRGAGRGRSATVRRAVGRRARGTHVPRGRCPLRPAGLTAAPPSQHHHRIPTWGHAWAGRKSSTGVQPVAGPAWPRGRTATTTRRSAGPS